MSIGDAVREINQNNGNSESNTALSIVSIVSGGILIAIAIGTKDYLGAMVTCSVIGSLLAVGGTAKVIYDCVRVPPIPVSLPDIEAAEPAPRRRSSPAPVLAADPLAFKTANQQSAPLSKHHATLNGKDTPAAASSTDSQNVGFTPAFK